MKKIFTLISMALVAMSVNAQVTWKAAEYDLTNAVLTTLTDGIYGAGTSAAPDTSVPGSLKSSTITVVEDGITMIAESTPNSDKTLATAADAWELKGTKPSDTNPTPKDALMTGVCTPQFAQYLMPQGNPEFQHWEFDEETDNGTSHRVYGTYWEIGATAMPSKGAYYKFVISKKGSLRVAVFGNKNSNPTYIVKESTKQPLDPSTVGVSIYYNADTGFAYEGTVEYDTDGVTIKSDTRKYFNEGTQASDYVLQHTNGITQNRTVIGYIDFDVEKDETYWLFNTKSQIGIYGFYFAPDDDANAISTVKAATQAADAPIYNLSGQKVSKDYKGVVIQNGVKRIQK